MFVLNFKVSPKKILITIAICIVAFAVLFEVKSSLSTEAVAKNDSKYDYILTEENYTETLKKIHDNISENVNKTIKMSGYVFRMPDFKQDIFVCGRDIMINNEQEVAGFLCQSNDSKNIKENEWIEITGIIVEGNYNSTMPVIQINSIKKISAPSNTFVK